MCVVAAAPNSTYSSLNSSYLNGPPVTDTIGLNISSFRVEHVYRYVDGPSRHRMVEL